MRDLLKNEYSNSRTYPTKFSATGLPAPSGTEVSLGGNESFVPTPTSTPSHPTGAFGGGDNVEAYSEAVAVNDTTQDDSIVVDEVIEVVNNDTNNTQSGGGYSGGGGGASEPTKTKAVAQWYKNPKTLGIIGAVAVGLFVVKKYVLK